MKIFFKLCLLCVFISVSFFSGCYNDEVTTEIYTDSRYNTPTPITTPTPALTSVPTPIGRDIVVVEDSNNDPDGALEAKAARNPGCLRPDSVEDMVDQVLDELNPGECIKKLTLIGHGSPGNISVGDGVGTESGKHIDGNRSEWESELQRLKDKLCDDATILLLGCNVGACDKGAAKLKELADFFGVPVEAPTGKVYGNCTEEEGSEHQIATPTHIPVCTNSPSDIIKKAEKDEPLPTPQVPPFDTGSVTTIALQPVVLGMCEPEDAEIKYEYTAEIESFFSRIDFSEYKYVEWVMGDYNFYVYIIFDTYYLEYIICSDYDYFHEKNDPNHVYEITWYLKEQLRAAYNP